MFSVQISFCHWSALPNLVPFILHNVYWLWWCLECLQDIRLRKTALLHLFLQNGLLMIGCNLFVLVVLIKIKRKNDFRWKLFDQFWRYKSAFLLENASSSSSSFNFQSHLRLLCIWKSFSPTSPLFPDAAFLAREKAKADAECYTAMKIAEANKVRDSTVLPWPGAQFIDPTSAKC